MTREFIFGYLINSVHTIGGSIIIINNFLKGGQARSQERRANLPSKALQVIKRSQIPQKRTSTISGETYQTANKAVIVTKQRITDIPQGRTVRSQKRRTNKPLKASTVIKGSPNSSKEDQYDLRRDVQPAKEGSK